MKNALVNGNGVPQLVQQLTTGCFLAGARISLSHNIPNSSAANPASYPGTLCLGVKRMVHGTDQSLPPSTDNDGAIPPTPPYISMHVVVLN